MNLSMYQASVPVFTSMLGNLEKILRISAAHAKAKAIDPSVFVNARLAPDMFALARQIQIATDQAKGGVARLAGEEPPVYADDEKTIAELIARVRKTISYIKKFKPKQIDGSDNKDIRFTIHNHKFDFKGTTYLLNWVLPNFYFHVTTAYNILRHNGVEIGKRDFLGGN